jgi:hypothetical protein
MRIGQIDGCWGAVYFFDDVGDGISMHRHRESDAHGIKVIGGDIMLYGINGSALQKGKTGDVLNVEWNKFHEIRATFPNTVIFNFFLNGYPADYAGLADEALSGNCAQILTHTLMEDGTLVMKSEFDGVFT